MASGTKTFLLAVGMSFVSATSVWAGDATDANAARLAELLAKIEQQSAKIDAQQAILDRQRTELDKQKSELMSLKASLVSSTASTALRPGSANHAEIVKTRYGYIPLPRMAPRGGETAQNASAAAPAPTMTAARVETQSASSAAQRSLVGRTAKNDLGIQAPQNLADAEAPQAKLHTLKDLVRQSVAPTLSGQSNSKPPAVGEKPEADSTGIDIAVLADRGGVLTPKGTLVIDPSVDYTHSSVNRFFFGGIEIAEAVLIGEFEAKEVDRESFSSGLGLRYGLTKRIEVSGGVSWLYRNDRTVNLNLAGGPDVLRELNGKGFSDVDVGINYQINKPKGMFPYFVANLRGKSNTGTGPYDVGRDLQTGLETELPTGSGFWSVEPSFTMIFPSDPAVLYANIGYQWNIEQDINATILDRYTTDLKINESIGTQTRTLTQVGNVDPGDSISASVGMGIGVNDSVSLSFGYQHNWVLGSDTEQTTSVFERSLNCIASPNPDPSTCDEDNPIGPFVLDSTQSSQGTSRSNDAQIGSLLIGASVNINEHVGLNFNIAAGLTADAPDVRISFRTPLSFQLYK